MVVVTPGGKPIMFYTILALIDPGDEVLYPNPGFPIYESMIRYIGGIPIPVRLLEDRAFELDVDQLVDRVGPKTRLIVINYPHNPTGGTIPEAGLRAIADVAARHGIPVLADEIYSELLYEGRHVSIASMPGMEPHAIVLDGFSKTYAMTGWRLGYGIMPAPAGGGGGQAADQRRLLHRHLHPEGRGRGAQGGQGAGPGDAGRVPPPPRRDRERPPEDPRLHLSAAARGRSTSSPTSPAPAPRPRCSPTAA